MLVGEVAEEEGLGQADLRELAEVQALVGAVGAGVGVLDAGDQDGRVGEAVGELLDERDRPTDPDVDRIGAVPRLCEGGPREGLDAHRSR